MALKISFDDMRHYCKKKDKGGMSLLQNFRWAKSWPYLSTNGEVLAPQIYNPEQK